MSISEHEAQVLADFEAYDAEVTTLRARVAELEAGNVRRQVALEARIAELERERDEARREWAVVRRDESTQHARALKAERDVARLREAAEYGQKAAEERGIMQGLDYWRRKGEEWKALLAEPLLTPKS